MDNNTTLAPGQTGNWQEVTREVTGPQFYCSYSYSEDGCPGDCCQCGGDSAMRIVYTRLRWSRSGKRHEQETRVEFVCLEHIGEDIL